MRAVAAAGGGCMSSDDAAGANNKGRTAVMIRVRVIVVAVVMLVCTTSIGSRSHKNCMRVYSIWERYAGPMSSSSSSYSCRRKSMETIDCIKEPS